MINALMRWFRLFFKRTAGCIPSWNRCHHSAILADDWNDYVIRCAGKRVQLWMNGLRIVDYVEPDDDIEQNGFIGLQIHSGPPSEVWYKDIEIKEL